MEIIVTDGFPHTILIVVFLIIGAGVALHLNMKSMRLVPSTSALVMLMSLRDAAGNVAYLRAGEILVGVMVGIIVLSSFYRNNQI